MLCGELVNGGLASAGAVSAPCGLVGLGLLPGCLRAGLSPSPLTGSPYISVLAELVAAKYFMELQQQHQLNNRNELQFNDDIDEDVFLGESPSFHLISPTCIQY